MAHAIVPLAHGFEEIEAVTVIDILRRAGIEVTVAGVGGTSIRGAHGITITCDTTIEAAGSMRADALVLPGGMPGTLHLRESAAVTRAVRDLHAAGKLVAAVCAAPTVLDACGVLDGKRATSFPGSRDEMTRCTYETAAVVRDGNVITSRGAGTSIAFAGAIVEYLAGADTANEILAAIQYAPRAG